MVRSVKRSLKKRIGQASLTHYELGTMSVEVESVINSRPLIYVFDNSEGHTVIVSFDIWLKGCQHT